MKRIILLLGILTLCFFDSNAQSFLLTPSDGFLKSSQPDLFLTGSGDVEIRGQRSNGSISSPSAVTNDRVLLNLIGEGYTGTGFSGDQVRIRMATAEAWTASAHGTWIQFSTTTNGTTAMNEKMRLTNDGKLGLGIAVPTSKFHVTDGYNGFGTDAQVKIEASSSGVFSGIDFTDHGTSNLWTILSNASSATDAANYLLFRSNQYGIVMDMRGDGDVGIGTASPQYPVQLLGTSETSSSTTGSFAIGLNNVQHMNFDPNEIDSWSNTTGQRLYLNYNAEAPIYIRDRLEVGTTSDNGKAVIYYDSNLGDPQLNLYEASSTDGARVKFRNTGSSNHWDLYGKPSTTAAGADFNIFYSQTGNIATFQGNGRVGIGTSNPSTIFEVSDTGSPFIRISDVSGGSAVGIEFFRTGSGSRDWRQQNIGGNLEFWVSYDDLVTSVSEYEMTPTAFQPGSDNVNNLGSGSLRWDNVYATNGTIQTSDRREKENIKNLNYGLSEVLKLTPVRYTWIDKPENGQKVGLIAQDVAQLVPEVVNGLQKDGSVGEDRLGMNYGELVPVLIKAIQEQQSIIENLKKSQSELTATVASLLNQFDVKESNTRNTEK